MTKSIKSKNHKKIDKLKMKRELENLEKSTYTNKQTRRRKFGK